LIAGIFADAMREKQIRSMDAGFLAEQFLYAVVNGPTNALIHSRKTKKSDKELRGRVAASVKLFLDGCRGSARRPRSS
jgi:hypothetical protein